MNIDIFEAYETDLKLRGANPDRSRTSCESPHDKKMVRPLVTYTALPRRRRSGGHPGSLGGQEQSSRRQHGQVKLGRPWINPNQTDQPGPNFHEILDHVLKEVERT